MHFHPVSRVEKQITPHLSFVLVLHTDILFGSLFLESVMMCYEFTALRLVCTLYLFPQGYYRKCSHAVLL